MHDASVGHYDGMLNAGFCAVIIAAMTEGAGSTRKNGPGRSGLPWISAYLLVPLALHRRTSASIKTSRHKGLVEFMSAHPELTIDLDRRIANIAPHVRAGLAMARLRNSIQVDDDLRTLVATGGSGDRMRRLRELLDDEDYDRIGVSARLGEWAVQTSIQQICGALLVRPTLTLPSRGNTPMESEAAPERTR